jgi:molybdate transport system substrate-binding protein
MDALAAKARVLSTLALKGVLEDLAPQLNVRFDATQAWLAAIRAGESADAVILTAEAIGELESQDKARSSLALGSSGVGLAVRQGAAKPDISSLDALKRSLIAAGSVAHSKVGASGLYFAGLLKQLGIADRLNVIVVEKGPVGAVIARGEAAIGVQQLCELAPVRGIDIVGPLPAEVQRTTTFSAAIMKDAKEPQAAAALLDFLCSEEAQAAMERYLISPAPSSRHRPG